MCIRFTQWDVLEYSLLNCDWLVRNACREDFYSRLIRNSTISIRYFRKESSFVYIISFVHGRKLLRNNSMISISENKSAVIKNIFKEVFNKENLKKPSWVLIAEIPPKKFWQQMNQQELIQFGNLLRIFCFVFVSSCFTFCSDITFEHYMHLSWTSTWC